MVDQQWFDEAALLAAVDLIGRAGAAEFEVGHLDDTPLASDARWWASAKWRGTKLLVEDQAGPVEATDLLARRLLDGGLCAHCGLEIRLDGAPAKPFPCCLWRRYGPRWERGCSGSITDDDRAIEWHTRGELPPLAHRPRAERRREARALAKAKRPRRD